MTMTPRRLGILLCMYALLSGACRWKSLHVPVLKIPFLQFAGASLKDMEWMRGVVGVFPFLGPVSLGWILLLLCLVAGVLLILKGRQSWQFSPLTLKQFKRFRSIRRGYLSFLILAVLAGIACLDSLLVGKRALLVSYEGKYYLPFIRNPIPGTEFGQTYDAETNYRDLKEVFQKEGKGNWVLMPPVPYDATLDTDEVVEQLQVRDGVVYSPRADTPFNGRAYNRFREKPSQKRQEWTFRNGKRHGEMLGWNLEGDQVEKARYVAGERADYADYSEGQAASLDAGAETDLYTIVYPPSPPSLIHNHILGTNTAGSDMFAILYGGWQQTLIAAMLFVTAVFGMGTLLGGSMAYFGGWYDLLGQRMMEIWSSLPFLFVIVIISSLISPTLIVLVVILAAFGWVGTTSYIRTSAYREKARDYVAAARLTGASTGRVIFKHILPNSISILVTLAPFEISSVISVLASLDYLGFGLPPELPSWGRLLREGTENFNYPWIVSSAFVALVVVLLLVTFVGEAIREAFDPKKFTTYE